MQKKHTTKDLSYETLRELLNYNAETGVFIWKSYRCQIAKKGDIAGTIKDNGYRYIRIGNKSYRANRLAWFYMEGYFPEHEVDHKDRIRDNNKWRNLVEKTAQCNARNRGVRNDSKTGVSGVLKYKANGKYQSSITISPKKRKHLGYFESMESAVLARWEAEKKYGFPNCQTSSSSFLYLKKNGII
jgi:hypothetical protein